MSHLSDVEAQLPEESGRSHKLVYTILALVALALVIIGLFTYSQDRKDAIALQKAEQLMVAFQAAGLTTPEDATVFSSMFGTDGGALCEDPGSALNKALFSINFVNGGAGVGTRPVIADARVIQGERLALSVYCPEELADFEEYVKDQKYDDVLDD